MPKQAHCVRVIPFTKCELWPISLCEELSLSETPRVAIGQLGIVHVFHNTGVLPLLIGWQG